MTLVSIVVVLGIKSYTINAQDQPMNDGDLELLAGIELLNHSDTVRHQKMIDRFVKSLEKAEFLYGRFTGPAEIPNEVYADYERIQRVGTHEELQLLMTHDSPIVRLYAHQAMAINGMDMDRSTLESMLNDTTLVLVQNGLEIKQVPVMELAAEYVFRTTAE